MLIVKLPILALPEYEKKISIFVKCTEQWVLKLCIHLPPPPPLPPSDLGHRRVNPERQKQHHLQRNLDRYMTDDLLTFNFNHSGMETTWDNLAPNLPDTYCLGKHSFWTKFQENGNFSNTMEVPRSFQGHKE